MAVQRPVTVQVKEKGAQALAEAPIPFKWAWLT